MSGGATVTSKRRKRSADEFEYFGENFNRISFEQLESCAEQKVDFRDVPALTKGMYAQRFRQELKELKQEIQDSQLEHMFENDDDYSAFAYHSTCIQSIYFLLI